MTKTKILFISHSPYFNGAEICLLTLVKYLDKDRFTPVVIFPSEGPLKDEMEGMGIKTYLLPLERWIRYQFDLLLQEDIHFRVQRIIDIIEKEAIQLVHTNTTVIHEGAIAARIKNIPHVWHVHELLEGHPEIKPVVPLPLIYLTMSFLSEKVVTPAELIKKQFIEVIEPSKLVTIYNGIDRKQFLQAESSSIRMELGMADDEILVVTVGGLTERKGYPDLLKAASLVRKQNKRIRFLCVGPASEEAIKDFFAKIQEWDLGDSVIHVGFRSDVPAILKEADLYVLSSINEAFPMVVLEAMAAGKSVVTTDCGGVRESVIDGETGFVVPVNDPESLSKKILELALDKEKRLRMGEKGLERFNENFTAEVYAGRFEGLYTELLGREKSVLTEKEKVLFDGFVQAYGNLSEKIRTIFEQGKQLEKERAEANRQIAEKDRQIEEKDRQIEEKDRQVETLMNSYSWKITAPMRKVLGLFKK